MAEVEREENDVGRLGFLLDRRSSEQLLDLCRHSGQAPFRIVSEAIATLWNHFEGDS